MRAFPPPSPAMLGAVKGEEDQGRPHQSLRDSFSRRAGEAKDCPPPAAGEGARRAEGGAFDLAPDLRVPVCRGEGRSEMLAESRARCARVRCTHRDVRSTNPGLTSRTAEGGAASGVHFSWLLLFVQAKRSDPRAGRARKGERTRSETIKNQSKNWIPSSRELRTERMTSDAPRQVSNFTLSR